MIATETQQGQLPLKESPGHGTRGRVPYDVLAVAQSGDHAESGTHDGDAGIAVLARAVVASCHGNFLIP